MAAVAPDRRNTLNPARGPARQATSLGLTQEKVDGPLSFLNPTQAHFTQIDGVSKKTSNASPDEDEGAADERVQGKGDVSASNVRFKWTSRNNRKGRYVMLSIADLNFGVILTGSLQGIHLSSSPRMQTMQNTSSLRRRRGSERC